MVRHAYKKDPKRDPNLENYPDGSGILGFGDSGRLAGFCLHEDDVKGLRTGFRGSGLDFRV